MLNARAREKNTHKSHDNNPDKNRSAPPNQPMIARSIIDESAQAALTKNGQPYRVLLVEDDIELARLTAEYLTHRGLEVLIEHNGGAAVARVATEQPDMLVLDVMLPDMDGLEICRTLRRQGNDVPILMLTARDEDIDQVTGLEMGADDYLAKPVQPRVLLAQMHAILRRVSPATASGSNTSSARHGADGGGFSGPDRASAQDNQGARAAAFNSVLQFGRLHISRDARDVTLGETKVDLTTAEFDLLWLLAANAGRVLPRNEILKVLRGLEYDGIDRSIDSRVSRLRRKLGDDAIASAHIKTVRPHGYLFSPVDW